jgi:hypothetical protein
MVAEGAATPDDAVRVVVVDDQELFRRGLTMLLGVEPGIEVVGPKLFLPEVFWVSGRAQILRRVCKLKVPRK